MKPLLIPETSTTPAVTLDADKGIFEISALYLIRNTKVLWYYREDDEYLKEAGEEFFELVNIPFEFKTY
jgi:hypothetical protein